MSSEDYYHVLGLVKPSDPTEIKKAYHRLALKWHPDKNKAPEATETFKKISEAYDILSNPEKKEIYDKCGKDGLNRNGIHFDDSNINNIFRAFFGGGGGPFGSMGGGAQFSFGGPFVFNPFGGGGPAGPQDPAGSEPIEIREIMTRKDVFTGKTTFQTVERDSPCETCHGMGSKDGKNIVCQMCHGSKILRRSLQQGCMIQTMVGPCPQCRGNGHTAGDNVCVKCQGQGIQKERTSLKIDIPKGYVEGNHVTLSEQGHWNTEKGRRGDVNVRIEIVRDPVYNRGNIIKNKIQMSPHDLMVSIELTIAEALCGFVKKFNHVSGREITYETTDVTNEGDVYVMSNQGLPTPTGEYGHLYFTFTIKPTIQIDKSKKQVLWELLTDTPYNEHSPNVNISKI
jgi:DnaJ-class molecular chaperone